MEGKPETDKLKGEIEFRQIYFGYNPLERALIEDFSLHLQPGAKIALAGKSGSGKTTVARLTAGLLQQRSGVILFDGVPQEHVPRDLLAKSITMVNQDIVLFNDAKLWIGKHQANRRNLTAFQRAKIALKLKDAMKERQRAAGGDRKSSEKSLVATLPQVIESKKTREELAELADVGSRTLDKVEFISEHADEETKAKLRRGEKGTFINKEYNRLKEESKPETDADVSTTENNEVKPFPSFRIRLNRTFPRQR